MNSKLTKFDKEMSAVTFAEAGEFDTATKFIAGKDGFSEDKQAPLAHKRWYGSMEYAEIAPARPDHQPRCISDTSHAAV